METKVITWFIIDLLGITGLGNGIISGIDSYKEAIIFILAGVYMLARLVVYIVRNWIKIRTELIDLKEREFKQKRKQ